MIEFITFCSIVSIILLGLLVIGSIIAHQHKLTLRLNKLEKVYNMNIIDNIKYIVVIISIYMLFNVSGCIPFIPVSP